MRFENVLKMSSSLLIKIIIVGAGRLVTALSSGLISGILPRPVSIYRILTVFTIVFIRAQATSVQVI